MLTKTLIEKNVKSDNSIQIWLCSTVQKGHGDSSDSSMNMNLIGYKV